MKFSDIKSIIRNRLAIRSVSDSSSGLKLESLERRTLLSTLISQDPGRNARGATELVLKDSGETVIESTISGVRDIDCYSFTATETGLMTVTMAAIDGDGDNWLDPYLSVYNSRLRMVVRNNNASFGTMDAAVEFYVQSGDTYYIRADGLKRSWGDYELTIISPDSDGPQFEETDYPNRLSTALDITTGYETDYGSILIAGGIDSGRDLDVFSFAVPADGEYTITMTATDTILDTFLYIYNENGRLIGANDDNGWPDTDSEVEISLEAGDTIYIRADAWRHSTGTYELTIVSDALLVDSIDSSQEDDSATNVDDGSDSGSDSDQVDNTPDSDSGTETDEGNSDNTDNGTADNDSNGAVEEYVETVPDDETVVVESPVEGYLVSFCAWDYSGTINDLAGPLIDGQIVEQVFTDTYGFEDSNVHIIYGTETTLTVETMAAEFEWLASVVDSNDIVVVHYSGHGTSGDSVRRNDNEGLYLPDGNTVYAEDLEGWLNNIVVEATKLVILDSCYSGGLVSIANNVSNSYVLASSRYNQSAWDEVAQFSPANASFGGGGVFCNWFGYGILSGEADSDNDGTVSILEAFNYTDRNVNSATGRGYYNQDPTMNTPLNFDYEILLG